MQKIVNDHAKMHEDTGDKVQKEKIMMRGCKWKIDKIVEMPMNVIINEKK